MTTAHRPTWKAAVGKASGGVGSLSGISSKAVSELDAPAHTKLKLRAGPQIVDRTKALQEALLKMVNDERKRRSISIVYRRLATVLALKRHFGMHRGTTFASTFGAAVCDLDRGTVSLHMAWLRKKDFIRKVSEYSKRRYGKPIPIWQLTCRLVQKT